MAAIDAYNEKATTENIEEIIKQASKRKLEGKIPIDSMADYCLLEFDLGEHLPVTALKD